MKLIILLLAMLTGVGTSVKKSVDDVENLKRTIELNQYKDYPNLLPEVEIIAPRLDSVPQK